MPESSLANLHILVVEDDPTTLRIILKMLEGLGVKKISTAMTGVDAVARLTAGGAVTDCILCDLRIPQGNGLELLRQVRSGMVKTVRPDTCFILVTSSTDPNGLKAAAELAVNGYLVKPVTPEKISAAITKGRTRAIAVDIKKFAAVMLPAL